MTKQKDSFQPKSKQQPFNRTMAAKVLVVGSGVIGLRTALELLKKNVSVLLKSDRSIWNPATCSSGAGGLWMPFHCDDPRTDRWAFETLDELWKAQEQGNRNIELVPAVAFKRHHSGPEVMDYISENYDMKGTGGESPLPAWTTDPRLQFQHLTVEMLSWQNTVFKLRLPSQMQLLAAGYKHAWFFKTPIIDSPNMLTAMLKEIEGHPNTVHVDTEHQYHSMHEIVQDAKSLGCDAVVNCTGLGAKHLCDDSQLVGARGILLEFDRRTSHRLFTTCMDPDGNDVLLKNDAVIMAEDAPWGTSTEPCYMIPRGDKLVVGGTYLEGDLRTEVSESERATLMAKAKILGIDSDVSAPVGEWTGFRPFRPTTRCEIDELYGISEGIKVIHSYGHGGSGWTVFVGAAREAASLLGYKS